ncbi:MAG: hypothetical protein IPO06_04265 [Leptospiraceae bacterium]|nr:hypothetical protein [Leptospiraceae bacterium]
MKKPKKVLSNRTPTIIKDIQQSLDTGVVKKEGYVTIAKVKDMTKSRKGKIHIMKVKFSALRMMFF